jgi:hypothetical protein
MGWRNRHPAPRRHDYESEEEYQSALADWYDAEDDAAEDYVERKIEERYDSRG